MFLFEITAFYIIQNKNLRIPKAQLILILLVLLPNYQSLFVKARNARTLKGSFIS